MAGDDFRHGEDRFLELGGALIGMAVDLDADEDGKAKANTAALQDGAIGLDIAVAFQPLYAPQAW